MKWLFDKALIELKLKKLKQGPELQDKIKEHLKGVTNIKGTEIKMENLKKVYADGITAINDFSLDIKSGEFVVLLGPSGCGKSTLLRSIAGLESITDGYLKFNGVTMNNVQSKDRNISMVFQNYALYPFMTVEKNISFGLMNKTTHLPSYKENAHNINIAKNSNYDEIQKLIAVRAAMRKASPELLDERLRLKRDIKMAKHAGDFANIAELKKELIRKNAELTKEKQSLERKKEIETITKKIQQLKQSGKKDAAALTKLREERNDIQMTWMAAIPNIVEEYTKLVNIYNYIKRRPADLSGGQRQRVALARAISKSSGLFLFDEPLSNLDAKLRESMRYEIRKLHDSLNATSIYVTHDQIEAMSMADRVVVMHKGYIQQVAKPIDLINHPQNLFVAKFIGSTEINLFNVRYEDNTNYKFVEKEGIVKSVNSAALAEDPEGMKNKNIILGIRPEHIITDPAIVDNTVENKFSGKVLSFELLGSNVLAKVDVPEIGVLNVVYRNDYVLKKGATVEIVIDPNKTHFFDAETGYNLFPIKEKANDNAMQVWMNNNDIRVRNTKMLVSQRLKMKFGERVWLLIKSAFSADARTQYKTRTAPIEVDDEMVA